LFHVFQLHIVLVLLKVNVTHLCHKVCTLQQLKVLVRASEIGVELVLQLFLPDRLKNLPRSYAKPQIIALCRPAQLGKSLIPCRHKLGAGSFDSSLIFIGEKRY
jgi:hypothetical protein